MNGSHLKSKYKNPFLMAPKEKNFPPFSESFLAGSKEDPIKFPNEEDEEEADNESEGIDAEETAIEELNGNEDEENEIVIKNVNRSSKKLIFTPPRTSGHHHHHHHHHHNSSSSIVNNNNNNNNNNNHVHSHLQNSPHIMFFEDASIDTLARVAPAEITVSQFFRFKEEEEEEDCEDEPGHEKKVKILLSPSMEGGDIPVVVFDKKTQKISRAVQTTVSIPFVSIEKR